VSRSFLLSELAERIGGEVRGDAGLRIEALATLDHAGPGQLSFLTNSKYRRAAETSRAGALLVGPDTGLEGRNLLVVHEPYLALAQLLQLFHPASAPPRGISPDARLAQRVETGRDVYVGPFAVIGEGTRLADGVIVGAGCVIGRECELGRGTELKPRAVLYPRTRVGRRCLIHSGVVLGGDGYGFASSGGEHHKLPQVGTVVLEDDVEIGANTTVDRAMLGETRIGRGSKIDNLVMIAHGVQLGPRSLLAGQAGIAGSARVGAGATLAGQAGVSGHLELGDGVVVAAKSAVFADLPQGSFVAGIPATDHRRWKRAQAVVARLPELRKEIRDLRHRLTELEQRLGAKE
jgi:UDP-3-O-[3-hydroxymyristoyl] glucosamine N-acyltransferase